jgi:DTW domain-containing protein YfiP
MMKTSMIIIISVEDSFSHLINRMVIPQNQRLAIFPFSNQPHNSSMINKICEKFIILFILKDIGWFIISSESIS